MKRLFLVLSTSIMILPWFAGAKVHAGMIQWSASASVVGGGGAANVLSEGYPGVPGSSVGINMSYDPKTNGVNAENVMLAGLNPYLTNESNNASTNSDFSGPSAQYQLSLLLRDQASGDSGTLTFRGYFSGSLPVMGFSWTPLKNTFVGPTTQTLHLGDNLYTVTIGPVVLPQNVIPNDDSPNSNSGSISASIAVQPAVNSTPEPSSLVLASLGLSSLALAGWRRRQRRRAAIEGDTDRK